MTLSIPTDVDRCVVRADGLDVSLTNLRKPFWPEDTLAPLGTGSITKGDLLRYYASVAPVLVPHLRDRAMVMKRYPHGAFGKCFWMKRAPSPRPDWIETCAITHASVSVIDFPMIQNTASLLWVVNLGCIDLNPWYGRCDGAGSERSEPVDRPDYLHFDLDPGDDVPFARVLEAALAVREALETLALTCHVKTSGSSGMHVYVPIVRGLTQKKVWTFAKAFAQAVAQQHPQLLTAQYRIADRPAGRVLVDYNQNAWGRTLASVYSPRPRPHAPVSTPLTWAEVEQGVEMTDFTVHTVPDRIASLGDLWAPLLPSHPNRCDLTRLIA